MTSPVSNSSLSSGTTTAAAAAAMMQTPFKVKSLYNNGSAGGVGSSNNNNGNHLFDDSSPLNPAEIYDSLKKTSHEIQKYSFSASFDSGTSQIDGKMQNLSNGKVPIENSVTNSTNETVTNSTPAVLTNGHSEVFEKTILEAEQSHMLDLDKTLDNVSFSAASLSDAIYYVQASTPNQVATTARRLYNRLLAHYETNAQTENKATKLAILRLIGQMLLKHPFEEEMERTLRLLVFVASHDSDKDVMKTAEETSQIAGAVFDAHKLFTFLAELINSEDSVTSIATIKILNRVCVSFIEN